MSRTLPMRRGLALLLVLLLAIVVVACGTQGGASSTTSAGGASTSASTSASTGGVSTSAPAGGVTSTAGAATSTSAPAGGVTSATAGGSTSTSAAGGSGALTVGVTEGPYYITNTKELADGNLNYAGLPGDQIKVSGYVYGGVGNATPLAGAKIELWHADGSGAYHPNTNGNAAAFGADQLALRGYVLTDANGHYEFTSIYPGIYPGRCRHIHARASETGYGAVVTQMIVPAKPGDSQTPETDQIAQSLPPVNDLQFTDNNGVQEATFDFHLGGD